jgi:hypothetical protein
MIVPVYYVLLEYGRVTFSRISMKILLSSLRRRATNFSPYEIVGGRLLFLHEVKTGECGYIIPMKVVGVLKEILQ